MPPPHCLSEAHAHQPEPSHPLTPREQFSQFYGVTLPPPLPPPEDPNAGYQYEGRGIIRTNRADFKFASQTPSTQTSPWLFDHDELLSKFHKLFVHSRTQMSSTTSKERHSRRTPSFRKHLMLTVGGDNDFDKQEIFTSFMIKQPTIETRPWSYDSFQTYPIMKLPPKKEKCVVKKIVDGEERDMEVEVEVYEEPKKLFLFAPTVVLR